jgi:hypothetical protein
MMTVSALVVHPSLRKPEKVTLFFVRASVSLIIFHTRYKFGRGKFRKVVKKSSSEDTCLKAMKHNCVSVL